jgi:thermostable 8-oxoguanine DNA glycosylase
MDAYLEEELYDLLTFCIQNPQSPEVTNKKQRVSEIGRELYADGGTDSLENMFFSIEHRIKDEIGADAKSYRVWWNGISDEWKY